MNLSKELESQPSWLEEAIKTQEVSAHQLASIDYILSNPDKDLEYGIQNLVSSDAPVTTTNSKTGFFIKKSELLIGLGLGTAVFLLLLFGIKTFTNNTPATTQVVNSSTALQTTQSIDNYSSVKNYILEVVPWIQGSITVDDLDMVYVDSHMFVKVNGDFMDPDYVILANVIESHPGVRGFTFAEGGIIVHLKPNK